MQAEILWILISITASIQMTLTLNWRLIPVTLKVKSRGALTMRKRISGVSPTHNLIE